MENSKIEWTHHTFNPWMGCAEVSPGCAHCYARTLMDTRYGKVKWGKGEQRVRTSAENWKQPYRWDRVAAASGNRRRVFCASLADIFDEEVSDEWRDDLFEMIVGTQNLDWLLLTKRPEKMASYLRNAMPEGMVLGHVWLGVSAENQAMWDLRVPVLMRILGAAHFVSAEPLLGPIRMGIHVPDWLIVGGESGHGARPMREEWVRDLRDQCLETRAARCGRVAFHFKQWGGVHKEDAGRVLDGQTWDETPGDIFCVNNQH